MIKVIISAKKIIIKGHANYEEAGKDIVCASASSIVITSVNAALRLEKNSLLVEQKPNLLVINIKSSNKNVLLIIENMISMLEELALSYCKNIKIIKEDEL